MEKLETWIHKKQREKPFFIGSLLFGVSKCYQLIVHLRHLLYQMKILKKVEASIPIFSVGNIVCGGSGKTELVSKIIQSLQREDIAILTRGYRSERKTKFSRKVCDEKDGDEPFLLQSRFPNNLVVVGKKREASAVFSKKNGAKAAILDDGMQYLKLKKNLEIVCVRAKNFCGNGFVPYGMRRELLSKLSVAHYIVIHGVEGAENYELVKRSILCYSRAKCFGTRYCLKINKELIGKKVGVFCGIGNPQSFMKDIEELGITIVHKKILADHEKIVDIRGFCSQASIKGAEKILCTEKDFIKLDSPSKHLVEPVSLDMEIVFDKKNYDIMIDNMNRSIKENNN